MGLGCTRKKHGCTALIQKVFQRLKYHQNLATILVTTSQNIKIWAKTCNRSMKFSAKDYNKRTENLAHFRMGDERGIPNSKHTPQVMFNLAFSHLISTSAKESSGSSLIRSRLYYSELCGYTLWRQGGETRVGNHALQPSTSDYYYKESQ